MSWTSCRRKKPSRWKNKHTHTHKHTRTQTHTHTHTHTHTRDHLLECDNNPFFDEFTIVAHGNQKYLLEN